MAEQNPDPVDERYPDPGTDGSPAVHRMAIHLIRLMRAAADFGDARVISILHGAAFVIGQAIAQDMVTTEEDGPPH